MPYLKENARLILDTELVKLLGAVEEVRADGDQPALTYEAAINYVICELFLEWFQGGYTAHSRGVGAIECAKQEIYRRVMAPHEDRASDRNGDIFDPSCQKV